MFTVWDVGGQEKLRPLWRHYFNNTDGLVLFCSTTLWFLLVTCVSFHYFCVFSHPSPHLLALLLLQYSQVSWYTYFCLCRFMLLTPWTERELDEPRQNFRYLVQKEIQFRYICHLLFLTYVCFLLQAIISDPFMLNSVILVFANKQDMVCNGISFWSLLAYEWCKGWLD